jgi:hypothetical protein
MQSFIIGTVYETFSRDERNYCIFSLADSSRTFIYFSHASRPLRSLFYGNGLLERVKALPEKSGICLECSLGTALTGGVSMDGKDCVAFNCSVDNANQILGSLKEHLGIECSWIEEF